MDKTVAFAAVADYSQVQIDAAIEGFFLGWAGADAIGAETNILLKPNLLAKHPPEHAVTTHPAVLRGVIRACKKRGAAPHNIIVADSAGGLYNPAQMRGLYSGCGLATVCEEEGVVAYSACETVPVPCTGKVVSEFEILRPILHADIIINLPKFKSHVMTGMTAACKNMFGVIPGLKKSEWHMRFPDKERFGDMLIDLLETVPPHFSILDGVLAMEGDGPAGGRPRTLGLLMAGEDALNLDLAVAHLMGLDPMRVPYLKAGHARGLCEDRFQIGDAVGEVGLYTPILNWTLPKSFQGNAVGDTDFAAFVPKLLRPGIQAIEHAVAPHPVVDGERCIGCGKCKEICSRHTITIKNRRAKIIQRNCIRCFCCHEVCPVKAIDVKKLSFFYF